MRVCNILQEHFNESGRQKQLPGKQPSIVHVGIRRIFYMFGHGILLHHSRLSDSYILSLNFSFAQNHPTIHSSSLSLHRIQVDEVALGVPCRRSYCVYVDPLPDLVLEIAQC